MKIFSTILLLFILSINGLTQTKTITNIQKMTSSSINYIMKDNIVTGYIMLHKLEKADKSNSTYTITILNTNLEETASKALVESSTIFLSESVFNGESIMLKFVDTQKKTLKYYCYNLSAELMFQKEMPINSIIEMYTLIGYANSNFGIESPRLVGVKNSGFINYSLLQNKELGYEISYTSSDGKKNWSVGSNKTSKEIFSAGYLKHNDNILLSAITTKPSQKSLESYYSISAIDINLGKELFNISIDDATFKHQILEAFFDTQNNQIKIMGLYFNPQDNIVKDLSKGMFYISIGLDGKIITSSHLSWKDGLSNYFSIKDNGEIDNIGNLYFHNIVKLNDGSFYAIAEQYKNLVNVDKAPCSIEMEYLYIMEFTSDFKLKNVTKYDKNKSVFKFYNECNMDNQTLALIVKGVGGFDYQYTLTNKDDSRFYISYIDFIKEENGKQKYELCYITKSINDNTYSLDKIPLETETTNIRIIVAKPGYVMILEYNKTTQTINMRLEKINY